jgi:hypothetical protein
VKIHAAGVSPARSRWADDEGFARLRRRWPGSKVAATLPGAMLANYGAVLSDHGLDAATDGVEDLESGP